MPSLNFTQSKTCTATDKEARCSKGTYVVHRSLYANIIKFWNN